MLSMQRLLILISLLGVLGCRELQKDPHDNCDIVVKNATEGPLWIMIDETPRGVVPNDGFQYAMWEGISTGEHRIEAYRDATYNQLHCWSNTPFLVNGVDFYWHLLPGDRFTGTWQGSCQ